MKKYLIIFLILVLLSFVIAIDGCSRNVDDVRSHAQEIFENNGFEIIGYHGYELSLIFGGKVWFTLKKGNITYQAALKKWFDEYHIYNLEAIDALKPTN